MEEIIKVNFETQTVSARALHEVLGIERRFSAWFDQFRDMFIEHEDFTSVLISTVVNNGASRQLEDYQLSIDMAKEICMMSRSDKGRECRKYFIDLEKAWNTPDQVMARALRIAGNTIESLKGEVSRMRPKEVFADAVSTSRSSILIGDLAKLLNQNGIEVGQKRLFNWLRENGYLMKIGCSKNLPTQRYVEQGLFEIKESTICNPDGSVRVTKTTKVTGKGQVYFVNKFLSAS